MQRAAQYLRPQCLDISKALMLSGGIEIAVIGIVFIMLCFAASYNNMWNPTTTDDVAKKEKYLNGIIITSCVFSALMLFVGIWHVYVAQKAKRCIEDTK